MWYQKVKLCNRAPEKYQWAAAEVGVTDVGIYPRSGGAHPSFLYVYARSTRGLSPMPRFSSRSRISRSIVLAATLFTQRIGGLVGDQLQKLNDYWCNSTGGTLVIIGCRTSCAKEYKVLAWLLQPLSPDKLLQPLRPDNWMY